uniref:DUF3857 domain-containing protein n=1 Tax=uncultured Draconibacterium sp. TaxID=1573823 RepID=UPI00321765EB
MKIHIWLLVFIALVSTSTYAAKEKKYVFADIPEALKKDAYSIVRLDERNYKVIDEGHMTMNRKYAITIVNSRDEDLARLMIVYDNFSKIKNLDARLYDANGELIEKVKPSDIMDINLAAGQSGTLTDGRVKAYKAVNSSYPFTFEFEYELESTAMLFYPDWQPLKSYNQSVESDIFSVTIPENINFEYKEMNLLTPVEISEEKDGTRHTWSLKNFTALKQEPHSPHFSEFTPYVYTRSKEFVMDGYEGSLDSWSTLGQWIEKLNEGRCELPAETVEELKKMVSECTTTEEKIYKIYKYLQSKTRYVSIQLGIGGWQTAPASEVDENGYGDCKALSNYMKAMLNAVGIQSNYTVINAGSDAKKIQANFPKSQFNHAILMVPNEQDTIWLECTSQRNPFRYQGSFTGNRTALIVDGENSRLVSTTPYTHKNNLINNSGEFKILPDGSATVNTNSKLTGLRYDDLRSIYFEGKEEQEKFLYDWIDLNDFSIEDYSIERKEGKYPEADFNLSLKVNQYATEMNGRLFVPVNKFNRSTYIPKRIGNRKTAVVKRNAYTENDEYTYILPEGYKVESLPDATDISGKFGTYKTNIKQEDNKIIFTRELVVFNGEFAKESYSEMIGFYKAINKGDKGKFVLVTL